MTPDATAADGVATAALGLLRLRTLLLEDSRSNFPAVLRAPLRIGSDTIVNASTAASTLSRSLSQALEASVHLLAARIVASHEIRRVSAVAFLEGKNAEESESASATAPSEASANANSSVYYTDVTLATRTVKRGEARGATQTERAAAAAARLHIAEGVDRLHETIVAALKLALKGAASRWGVLVQRPGGLGPRPLVRRFAVPSDNKQVTLVAILRANVAAIESILNAMCECGDATPLGRHTKSTSSTSSAPGTPNPSGAATSAIGVAANAVEMTEATLAASALASRCALLSALNQLGAESVPLTPVGGWADSVAAAGGKVNENDQDIIDDADAVAAAVAAAVAGGEDANPQQPSSSSSTTTASPPAATATTGGDVGKESDSRKRRPSLPAPAPPAAISLTPSDIAALRDLKATALLRLPIQKLRAYAAAIGVTNSRGDSDQAAIAGIPRAALVRAINTARERGARRGSVDDLAASWAVADDALLIGATTPDRNGGAAASAQSATSATPGSGFAQARTVTDSHRDSIAAVAEAGAAASALSGSKDNAVAGAVAEVCTNVEARGISECFISFNRMTEYLTNLM